MDGVAVNVPAMIGAAISLLVVTAGATLVLAVMSYVSSKLLLDGLEVLDHWLDARTKKSAGRGSVQ